MTVGQYHRVQSYYGTPVYAFFDFENPDILYQRSSDFSVDRVSKNTLPAGDICTRFKDKTRTFYIESLDPSQPILAQWDGKNHIVAWQGGAHFSDPESKILPGVKIIHRENFRFPYLQIQCGRDIREICTETMRSSPWVQFQDGKGHLFYQTHEPISQVYDPEREQKKYSFAEHPRWTRATHIQFANDPTRRILYDVLMKLELLEIPEVPGSPSITCQAFTEGEYCYWNITDPNKKTDVVFLTTVPEIYKQENGPFEGNVVEKDGTPYIRYKNNLGEIKEFPALHVPAS